MKLDRMISDSEVPAEFECPITMELMRDPVKLVTSGVTVERTAIMRALLNDEIDPFSRQPLTSDMLQPDDALRARIEAWLAACASGATGRITPTAASGTDLVLESQSAVTDAILHGQALIDSEVRHATSDSVGPPQTDQTQTVEEDEDLLLAIQLSMNDQW